MYDLCLFRAGEKGCAIKVWRDLTDKKQVAKFWLPGRRLTLHSEMFVHFNMQTNIFVSVFPLK